MQLHLLKPLLRQRGRIPLLTQHRSRQGPLRDRLQLQTVAGLRRQYRTLRHRFRIAALACVLAIESEAYLPLFGAQKRQERQGIWSQRRMQLTNQCPQI